MRLLLTACMLCLVVACHRTPRYQLPPDMQPASIEACETLDHLWPETFRMSQRVLVSVRGREFDFVGYLSVEPLELRALGIAEVGPTLFDLGIRGNEVFVNQLPPGMPPDPVREGVAGDLAMLYRVPPTDDACMSGNTVVVLCGAGAKRVYELGDATRSVDSVREIVDGRLEREGRFEDYRVVEGVAKPLPHFLRVRNHRWGYTIEARLLEWRSFGRK